MLLCSWSCSVTLLRNSDCHIRALMHLSAVEGFGCSAESVNREEKPPENTEIERTEKEAPKEKAGVSEDPESKKVEMGDWLFGHALLFRTHVGIDPDAHIDHMSLGWSSVLTLLRRQ
ncbi:Protein CLMP1 [Vitis vinifera]|uniref:Protein CLMP1 n=1 Tax=Vitis vinifera TaxID=29760 RepID=A0A438DVA4_VITVI|nr:Protein CLMP1 [Vitis vinifera]